MGARQSGRRAAWSALVGGLVVPALAAGPAAGGEREAAARLAGREAALVVRRGPTSEPIRINPRSAARRLPPCSTFKIPHTLIALAAGTIRADDPPVSWDPVRHPRRPGWPEGWAREHDLASALRHSVVWYYQDLARRVGTARMQAEIERIGYGNGDISGGIDRFWLGSSLRISAEEQAAFLARLRSGALGFAEEDLRFLREVLTLERGDSWAWIGKTGTCDDRAGGIVAWLVGWVERDGTAASYALQVRGDDFATLWRERMPLARSLLADLGLLPAGAEAAPSREQGAGAEEVP